MAADGQQNGIRILLQHIGYKSDICAAGVDEVLSRLVREGVATSATATRAPRMVRAGPVDNVAPAVAHLHFENLILGNRADDSTSALPDPPFLYMLH